MASSFSASPAFIWFMSCELGLGLGLGLGLRLRLGLGLGLRVL